MKKLSILFLATAILASCVSAQTTTNADPDKAKIVTSDIELFWRAFDKAAAAENKIAVFQEEYLQKGSVGLQEFTRLRISDARRLTAAINSSPKYYAALREPSLRISAYEKRVRKSFRNLKKIYPDAVFPDVYFLIGRMNSAGTLSDRGLLIGADMFGKNPKAALDELGDWHKAVVAPTDRLPFIVAHELIHYQQKYPSSDSPRTLLAAAIGEGAADFVAELIAGCTINPHLHRYGNRREQELWQAFKREMDGANIGNWLYQGDKAKDKPADLGYYVGYKICESYYKNHKNKKQAVRDILEIKDFAGFLADSRYEEKFSARGE